LNHTAYIKGDDERNSQILREQYYRTKGLQPLVLTSIQTNTPSLLSAIPGGGGGFDVMGFGPSGILNPINPWNSINPISPWYNTGPFHLQGHPDPNPTSVSSHSTSEIDYIDTFDDDGGDGGDGCGGGGCGGGGCGD
jgi:hypothetical protein